MSSSQIVREAIRASGGIGELWYLDGANAVRAGELLFVIDADELGWLAAVYVVDNDEAVPVGVRASENDDPVRELAGWLRNAARPMRWTRITAGLYRSGAYLVGQLGTGEWFAEGPGVDRCFDTKHDAQAACATARINPTTSAAGEH